MGYVKKRGYCPITKRICAGEDCEWMTGKGNYAECGVKAVASLGFKLYKIQQALEGGGARGGGGFVDDPPPKKVKPPTGANYPQEDSEEDFEDGPF